MQQSPDPFHQGQPRAPSAENSLTPSQPLSSRLGIPAFWCFRMCRGSLSKGIDSLHQLPLVPEGLTGAGPRVADTPGLGLGGPHVTAACPKPQPPCFLPDLPCLRFPRRPPSQLHLGCIAPLLAPAPPPRRGRDGFCCPLLSGGPATLAPAPQVSGLHGEHTERTPRFLLSGPKCGRRSAAWGIGDSKLGPRGGRWQEVCRQVNVWTRRHIGGSWGQGLPSGFSARG